MCAAEVEVIDVKVSIIDEEGDLFDDPVELCCLCCVLFY